MPVSALASAVSQPVPIVIARVDGPLFFADARPVPPPALARARPGGEAPTRIVVDAEAVHLTDTDGADMLIQFEEELRSPGLALALARVHPPVLALWKRAGVIDTIGEGNVFDTLHDAVQTLTDGRPLARQAPAKGAGR